MRSTWLSWHTFLSGPDAGLLTGTNGENPRAARLIDVQLWFKMSSAKWLSNCSTYYFCLPLCSQIPLGRYVAFPGYIQVSQDCGQVLLKIAGISIVSQPCRQCLKRPSYTCLIHFIKRCVSTKVSTFGSNVWEGWWQPADAITVLHHHNARMLAATRNTWSRGMHMFRVNNIEYFGRERNFELILFWNNLEK